MSAADEEARAKAFRATSRRRILNERARADSLGGNRVAFAALHDNWEAMRVWLLERRDKVPYQPPNPDRPHGIGPHRGGSDGSI